MVFSQEPIFAGIGLGIAASGTLVSLLICQGLTNAWCGLGLISLLLTVIAWRGWPNQAISSTITPKVSNEISQSVQHRPPLWRLRALYAEYALNAMGLVPHMLFLVDFIARGLGQGLERGAQYWIVFGIGAICEPILSGYLADCIGFGSSLRLAFLIQILAVLLPALGFGKISLFVSSFVFTPGIVPLVLGRIHELLPTDLGTQKNSWSIATMSFALLQAVGAYGDTFLLVQTDNNYHLLFLLGSVSLLLTLCIDFAVGKYSRK
jgi:predicted MFS family arabinose efflux permease